MTLGIEAGSKAVLITTDLDDEEAGDIFVMAPGWPERLDGFPEGIYTFEGETTLIDVGPASIYIITGEHYLAG